MRHTDRRQSRWGALVCCLAIMTGAGFVPRSRMVAAMGTEPNGAAKGATAAGVDEIRLGLLAPVKSTDGGPPSYPDFLARYGLLVRRFFPEDVAVNPKVRYVSGDPRSLQEFEGLLNVSFDTRNGLVSGLSEPKTSMDAARVSPGTTERIEEAERVRIAPELAEELSAKLGVVFPAKEWLVDLTRKRNKEGRTVLLAQWLMWYHGHRHLDDGICAWFEVRDGKPYAYLVANFGSKIVPKGQAINITSEQAADTSITVATALFDWARKKEPAFDMTVVGHEVEPSLSYVYRNDVLNLANLASIREEVFYRYESHLCYVVKVKAGPSPVAAKAGIRQTVLTVFVDCTDGSIVGGKR